MNYKGNPFYIAVGTTGVYYWWCEKHKIHGVASATLTTHLDNSHGGSSA